MDNIGGYNPNEVNSRPTRQGGNQTQGQYNGQQYQYGGTQQQYGSQPNQYGGQQQQYEVPQQFASQQQYNSNIQNQNNTVSTSTKWNWGAMMFTWIWGIANGTYMPFLAFIPFLNMFWWIVCGIKGSEWAKASGMWKTNEEFEAVQKSWNRAGKIAFWVSLIFIVLFVVIFVGAFMIGLFGGLLSIADY